MVHIGVYLVGCIMAAVIHLYSVKSMGSKRVKLVYFILSALASWLTVIGWVIYATVWDITFLNPLGYDGPSEATNIEALRRRADRVNTLFQSIDTALHSEDFNEPKKLETLKSLNELRALVSSTPELVNGEFKKLNDAKN